MDDSIKIMLTVFFEILFLYDIISLLMGVMKLHKSGAVSLTTKDVKILLWVLPIFSILTQIAFILMLAVFSYPNYYLLSMVSGFSALYAKILGSENIFSYEEKQNWFGFKSYEKGSVKAGMQDKRRSKLNVMMTPKSGNSFVLRTTPELWEEIQKHL